MYGLNDRKQKPFVKTYFLMKLYIVHKVSVNYFKEVKLLIKLIGTLFKFFFLFM